MLSVEEFDEAVEGLKTAFPNPLETLLPLHINEDLERILGSLVVREVEGGEGTFVWLDQTEPIAAMALNIIDNSPEARDLLHTLFMMSDDGHGRGSLNEPPIYLRRVRAQMLIEGRPKLNKGRPRKTPKQTVIVALISDLAERYKVPACGDNEDSEHTAYELLKTAYDGIIPAHGTVVKYWKNRQKLLAMASPIIDAIKKALNNPNDAERSLKHALFSRDLLDLKASGIPNSVDQMEGPGFDTSVHVWSTAPQYQWLKRTSMHEKATPFGAKNGSNPPPKVSILNSI